MENIVYSYGGGEALFKVLTGVKMIFEHGATKSLLYLMTFIGLSWAAFQGAQQNSWMPKLSWLAKYTLITSLFITPTATLWVTDVVYKVREKVDGLPIGLVLPASIFSGIGYGITELFDQAFNEVTNNIPYSKYGQSFGAALISQSRNFKIQDAGFRENMESFIDNCVLYDVMVGRKYSGSELRDHHDIWGLVKKNASNIRMMNYRDFIDKKLGRKLVTCREGVELLESYWETDIEKLGKKFGSTIFGKYGTKVTESIGYTNQEFLGKAFRTNVKVVSRLYSNGGEATDNLKQIMMINALSDIPMSYGAVRAKQQQQESWLISGQLAREILPTIHAIFAALIYASFTLIVGMLVLPNGFRTLANYLGLLIWIETWPPLFAVLNLLSNISSKTYGGDFNSVTMNNISQIVTHNNNISVVASGMMMVLPYLSYNILKGGAGQFVHLASQVMGSSQSAAMAASNEVISGNRSLDNVSMLNGQWLNNSGFKTDMNSSFKSGHREYQLASGMMVKEALGGKIITQAGPGITESTGTKSMHMAENHSTQTHQSISKEQANIASWTTDYEIAKQAMNQQRVELVDRMAVGIASGEDYSINYATADGKILNEGIAKSKDLHNNFAYNNNQAADVTISAGVNGNLAANARAGSGGGDIIPVGGKVSAEISLEAGGKVSGRAESVDSQSLSEDKGASINDNITKQNEAIARAVKDIKFTENQSEEKALANALVGSYEEMESLREKIEASAQKIARYQATEDSSQSNSFTVNEDRYAKEVNFIANHRDKDGFRISPVRAAQIIEEGGEEYKNYHRAYTSSLPSHQKVQQPEFNHEQLIKEIIPQNVDMTKNYTEVDEFGNSVMKSEKAVTPVAKGLVEQQYKVVSDKIKIKEQEILQNGEQIQKDVNKREGKRWTRGVFGRKKDKNTSFVE